MRGPARSSPSSLLDRLRPSEEFVLVLTSVIVGIGAGIGAVIFRFLIRGVEWVGYDWFPSLVSSFGKTYVIVVPAVGGLFAGLLIFHFAREAKGHGVPEVMEAVALKGGRIRPIVAVIKSLASSLSIGSGGSVGREGPIVQIGSALGSSIGRIFHLSDDRIRNLVACGAAGGIAATFNTPIAGVIFALEIISGEFSASYFSTVVISAVSASVVGQAVFGDVPAFPIPVEYHINNILEFGLYPILGILAALVGVVFVKSLYWSEDLFARWKSVPEWVQPAVGGALLGALALGYPAVSGVNWDRIPQIFNVGYEVIGGTLRNEIVLGTVVLLLVLKLIATALTLGSGGSGGVFAPSLFMGSMLGSAFGVLVNAAAPFVPAPPGAYALVGMGAVFAAAAHAPLTAIIILFELTGDYQIILPLMLTVVVATLISRKLLAGESIYTLKLSRRGVRIKSGRDVDILRGVRVDEVMTTSVDTVIHDLTIVDFSEVLSTGRHRRFPILSDSGDLLGMVTSSDLKRAVLADAPRSTMVLQIGKTLQGLIVAYPDDSINDVLEKMGPRGLGRLPVVSRTNPRNLMGMIAREDIVRAYQIALTRRSEITHRVRRAEMKVSEATEFVEIQISEGDRSLGTTIHEIGPSLPRECVLVSIDREGNIIIPHGDSILLAGDILTVYSRTNAIEALVEALKG